jgi:hypothetical protein
MADLSVTIGLDQSELEKGLANAGKSLGKLSGAVQAGKNPFQATANQLGTAQGIGSLLGGPIGGIIGAFVDAFGAAISAVYDKIKELADYAQNLRRISIATGVSINELSKMEGFAAAFGVSLQSIAGAFTEFTRRMGEVRIKGGELTNILAKMGVGMDEVANGTFNHQQALKMLADAYAAGTDEATLLYYGTKMFGDSFKDMLPMIKAGSKAVEDASSTYFEAGNETSAALGRLSQDLDNIGRSIKNIFIDILGGFMDMVEEIQFSINNFFSLGAWNPFESLEDEVKRKIANAPKYMTNEEITKFVLAEVDEDKRDEAKKEIEKQLKGDGKVLTPFGMSEAGAASQMQQMGGGDIFGAVAFTPLERIATATEETAQNTKPKDAPAPRAPDELSR